MGQGPGAMSESMGILVSKKLILRTEPTNSDKEAIVEILHSTGNFYPHEISIAIELIDDRLRKGLASEYLFTFADIAQCVAGYICYGPITMTIGRFDIHWIAVRKDYQCRGIGGLLLKEAEMDILRRGGKYVFVDTSSRDAYSGTRAFYRRHSYIEIARIPDYYTDGDDKVVLMKSLGFSRGP